MVPAKSGCSFSDGRSAARVADPGDGASILGAGANVSAREGRLGCDHGNTFRIAGPGVHITLGLAGENELYVGELPAEPDAADEVVWHVWSEVPEVSEKLGRLAVAYLLELKELKDASLSRGGQPLHQRGVGVLFRWRGDDVLYFRGVPIVQLRDHKM
jgi:hypothetical protein